MKKAVKVLIILVLVAGAGFGAYTLWNKMDATAQTTQESKYTPMSLSIGTIAQSVVSTGSLAMKDSMAITAPMDITVDQVLVKAGDAISAGQAVLSIETGPLNERINTLKDELTTQDQTLATLAAQYKETTTLKSPVAGRVKIINLTVGSFLQQDAQGQDAIITFSLDGLMKAEFTGVSGLNASSEVQVVSDGVTYTGSITSMKDDTVTVTFSDRKVLPGDEVQLLSSGALLGTSQAQINMPYLYTTEDEGYISSITAKVNALVVKNGTLLTISRSALSRAYEQAVTARQAITEDLALAQKLLADPQLYAAEDGIVATVTASDGAAIASGATVLTSFTGTAMQMAISVDELDIIHVKTGQTASLKMDALPDTTYEATVTHISQVGTASSGVTNYTVTLDLEQDAQLKIGMNGTATIQVGEQSGLLVPLQAVQSDAGGSYVWLYQADWVQTADEPGVKTYITTGLSNTNYAAVIGGLQQGSQVLLVRSSATAISTQQNNGMGFTQQMPFGEGTMPQGITGMPEGVPGGPGGDGNFPRERNNGN